MNKTIAWAEGTFVNVTEPFTVMLTNEAQQFATDSNRKVTSAQSYYTDIIVIRGSQERTDYTIGNITSGSGITVSKNSKRVTFSVSAGAIIGADAGVIEIPITLDGQTVKKQFSWSCGKQGPQGVKGEDGSNFAWNLLKGTGTAKEFTPKGNLTNQTTLFNKLDLSGQTLKEGDKFVISCDLEWTQFTQGTSGTFDYWFQGSVDYSWSYDNIFTQGLQKVQPTKAEILASDGKKHLSAVCTMKQSLLDKKIFEIGIRFDNTDGTGKIKISNLKIAKEDKESPWCLHPDELKGDKGKSVQSVIEYYLATSASSNVTSSTNGWSTDPTTQKLTAEKKYLWNCKQTVYDDGTRGSITSPVICGTYGDKGNDGQTSYVHTAYANITFVCKEHQSFTLTESTLLRYGKNGKWVYKIFAAGTYNATTGVFGGNDPATGLAKEVDKITDFSATDTTGRLYTGQYSDFTETASTDPSKYNWAKTTGDNGISPKVSLSKSGNTTTISIVDATGTHTQTVKDGTNGTPGAAGKDGKTNYFHVKYSNDGGKTFTGNSGEDTGIYMGSYTDYTEADSTDVKKYTWIKVKGDKGDTGQKGQDGTSIKITSKSVTYQASTSGTTAPTGTWSTTVPTVNNGQYLWTKTTVQYSDGNKTEAYSVSYKGTNGTNGTSVTVSKTEVTYQVSTSGTTAPTGTWSTTMPSCDQGQYLWTKTYVKYSDGKDTTSYSVSYKGVDGEKFAFNMLRETNQGSKHWEQQSSGGKYSVEDFITEDNINAVKLICTEAISTSNWSYVSFKDIKMLKQLKPSTKYTLSYDIKANRSGTISHSICNGSASNFCTNTVVVNNIIGNETWQHISVVLTTNDLKTTPTNEILYLGRNALSKVGYSIIKNLKLTEGIVDTPWAPHPEDLEGRGVSETIQYYLATSQASGVTSSTSGWSTDITTQKLTADKKYLWNCYQTKYSDGTSEPISTPKVIGVYGDKGQKGDNAKNLSITPSSQYFKSTDGGKTFAPNTITIKPTIQGEISFSKWQYSIDGGVSFTDVVSGQKGLTVSNNVLAVSKDSSLYSDAVTMVTFRAVANDSSFYDTCSIAKIYDVSDIGDGRNLWITRDNITLQACEKDKYIYTTTGTSSVCIGATGSSVGTNTIALQTGTKYTISFVISSPSDVGDAMWYFCTALNSTGVKNYGGYGVKLATGENIVSQTITVDTSCDAAGLVLYNLPTGCVIKDIQVEKGSSPTGWTPAPEDVQTAILSTKSEISDVSLKVDKNKQAIEQRVEKTTYQQDLNLVKGDISKANEGLNKWRYEIYPKSLFASEYQGKSTMDVFAKNTNLTPSQSVLINDTYFGKSWAYGDNYIGYALTFVKFSAAKSVAITFKHDDGAHLYLNGKLIGGDDTCNTGSGESLTLSFIQGWNCLEVVLNEKSGGEYIGLGTTISAISECQLMNCYYGTPVARQSHITNQLVENTTNINGISTKVSKVTSVIGDNGENFTSFKNDYSDFKQTMNGFKTTVGQTYVTKDDFNGLEIGGRNLLLYSANLKNGYYTNIYDTADETFKGCSVFKVNHAWNGIRPYFNKHITERNVIKAEDVLTYSVYAKTDDTKEIAIMMFNRTMDNGSGQDAIRGNQGQLKLSNDWKLYSITFKVTESMLSVDKGLSWFGYELCDNTSSGKYVYFTCPKLEKGNKATDWTPAPEDVNGKIVNVETIANQTAKEFSWIVKGGDSSSNFTLTDRVADLVAERINFKGLVTFSGLNTDAKNEIGKVAQSKVDGLEVGGRNLLVQKNITEGYLSTDGKGSFVGSGGGDQTSDWIDVSGNKYITVTLYEDFTNTNNSGRYCEYDADKNCINTVDYNPRQKSSIIIELKSNTKYIRVTAIECKTRRYKIEKGNKATDWTPAPEDVSQDATNKANQALTDAKSYSSSAVNWVTNNGASTTNLNSMVKKWTDGAVSDTTQINGGWIKANTITANKIAIGDFTNYADDPDFENGLYSPTGTFSLSTEQKYVGTKSLKMASGTVAYRDTAISPEFYLEKDEEIYVEYYVYRNGANHSAGVCIGASTSNYGSAVYDISGQKMASANITDKTWTKISYVGKANRSGMWYASFKHGSDTTLTGDWYLDHVTIRKRATGNLIVDGSITANKIAANTITADKIATDAIKSRNYISSGGTQGSFLNLSDGSFTSPNLSWDSNGNLIAKNANLSGQITATKGSIGKYKIDGQWLITGSGSTATGIGGNQAFWAGAEDSNSAPFRVGYNGKLYANGATISGDITATTGKIGDLTLKDGILTGTGSYSEPYTEDDDSTVTSTITTNYITKLFGKGLTIDSTVKYSDEDDVYSYKVSVLPDEISFTDGEEIGMLGAGGLQILQVNDNSDSYSSEANEVSLSSGASNFYYTTPVNQTTDKYLHVCFSADGASFMASQGDKFNSFDIGYSSAKYSGNFAANKFVYTGNSSNYVECLEANDTTNVYFHSNGYYSFRVNNEGNWSNETQSVYITGRGVSVPGQIGLYSQEMSNYVARYYIAGSTKSTAIGNNSYQTRIYGSSVWANKAVSTSDVRLKQDFQSLDKFEDLYMQLQPVSFKYIDGYDKSEDRYFGLKAQPTEKLFEDMGENPDDYAMFNKFGIDHEDIKERIGYDVDFDEEHGLDYTNLITLNTHMVQKTRRELAELQKENAELKDMLKTIVKKINM